MSWKMPTYSPAPALRSLQKESENRYRYQLERPTCSLAYALQFLWSDNENWCPLPAAAPGYNFYKQKSENRSRYEMEKAHQQSCPCTPISTKRKVEQCRYEMEKAHLQLLLPRDNFYERKSKNRYLFEIEKTYQQLLRPRDNFYKRKSKY